MYGYNMGSENLKLNKFVFVSVSVGRAYLDKAPFERYESGFRSLLLPQKLNATSYKSDELTEMVKWPSIYEQSQQCLGRTGLIFLKNNLTRLVGV